MGRTSRSPRRLTTLLPAMAFVEVVGTTRIHPSPAAPATARHRSRDGRFMAPSYHLRCEADRLRPRDDAGRGVTGPQQRTLHGGTARVPPPWPRALAPSAGRELHTDTISPASQSSQPKPRWQRAWRPPLWGSCHIDRDRGSLQCPELGGSLGVYYETSTLDFNATPGFLPKHPLITCLIPRA